jgi:carbonic anhydrase
MVTMNTTSKLLTLASTVLLAVSPAQASDSHRTGASEINAEAALKKLQAGNARYVSHSGASDKSSLVGSKSAAKSQHPFAVVVSCSDSRTAPELVFDQKAGDLFVVRTPANLVDSNALGGIEYALENFGTKLVVVLGVKRCCFMESAVAKTAPSGRLGGIVRDLRPSVQAVKKDAGDLLVNAINENIYRTADKIVRGLKHGKDASSVRVVRALYDVDTGKVEILK